jgi:Sec-independent protein secretion pathway component TatC
MSAEPHVTRVSQSLRSQFLTVTSLSIVAGFAVSAVVTPPDPATQIRAALVALLVAVPLSYWLVYRRGLPL